MRVLLIQNDHHLHQTCSLVLEKLHYQVDVAENIQDGKYFVEIRNYKLIIMDYEIDSSISSLISHFKKISPKTCIIILSANHTKEAEILSLRSGADDFLIKPIDIDILLARIDTRLKRWNSSLINIKDLSIVPKEELVLFQGHKIDIKGKAFEILIHLVLHKNQIVSKEELLHSIWEEPELVTPNVIEVAINQIRQKLDKKFCITSIETIRKKGYRFCYPQDF